MTDRELLERAARAAGVFRGADRIDSGINVDGVSWPIWNPLEDDGDALRLAVRLKLLGSDNYCFVTAMYENGDPYAATRRAIVRAAAELAPD